MYSLGMYHSDSIHKPAKMYDENSEHSRPLWEEEVNDFTGKAVGWLTLAQNRQCKLVVIYRDLVARKAGSDPVEWIYDITDNKLGQFIIAGWRALNPEKFEALPKTPEEEYERGRKAWEEELALRAAEAHS